MYWKKNHRPPNYRADAHLHFHKIIVRAYIKSYIVCWRMAPASFTSDTHLQLNFNEDENFIRCDMSRIYTCMKIRYIWNNSYYNDFINNISSSTSSHTLNIHTFTFWLWFTLPWDRFNFDSETHPIYNRVIRLDIAFHFISFTINNP